MDTLFSLSPHRHVCATKVDGSVLHRSICVYTTISSKCSSSQSGLSKSSASFKAFFVGGPSEFLTEPLLNGGGVLEMDGDVWHWMAITGALDIGVGGLL